MTGRDSNGFDYDVFISHASEDKDDFVRQLATALDALGLTVWFDEWTLHVGDRLRRQIDSGLANSRFGVVVLSPNFFAKNWPQLELDGLTALEADGIDRILPVWHEVGREEVAGYSPTLADRLGVASSRGVDEVAAELYRSITRPGRVPTTPRAPRSAMPVTSTARTDGAVKLLKEYIPEPASRIRLTDLVSGSLERLIAGLTIERYPVYSSDVAATLVASAANYESDCEECLGLVANGSYFGDPGQATLWVRVVRRLAELEPPNNNNGQAGLLSLSRYPALLHFYAVGIGALAGEHYALLATLLRTPIRDARREEPAILSIFPHDVVSEEAAHIINPHPQAPQTKWKTPLSEHLRRMLRPLFAAIIPDDAEYQNAFDRFEYICSLVHADLHEVKYGGWGFAGGAFEWRQDTRQGWLPDAMTREIERAGNDWPLIREGLFGSLDRLLAVKQEIDDFARRHRHF